MKTFARLALIATCLAGLTLAATAQERQATLKGDRVNVRGRAALDSEVITQLREGEKITVLEEVTLEKPGPGEPAKWSRILLPSNTPVWVSTLFLDKETKTVTATKLNIRSGPGEQFSVVNQLLKGDKPREIRTVGDWMEIEPPTGTYAFVASDLLNFDEPAKPAEPVVAEKPAAPKEMAKAPVVQPPPPVLTVETIVAEPPPIVVADSKPKPAIPAKVEPPVVVPVPEPVTPAPIEAAPPKAPVVVAPVVVAEPVVAPAPPKSVAEEPPPKRIVQREGIVRRTWSIQAPSSYALEDAITKQVINYLYTADTGLELKYYIGETIRISGQESLDRRWTKTPLITIQTLEVLR